MDSANKRRRELRITGLSSGLFDRLKEAAAKAGVPVNKYATQLLSSQMDSPTPFEKKRLFDAAIATIAHYRQGLE